MKDSIKNMKKWDEILDEMSMEEIIARAEEIEKEMELDPGIETPPDEKLLAYEKMKKQKRKEQEEIEKLERKAEKCYFGEKIQRCAAVIVIGILCVSVAGMTIEANRSWLVNRMRYVNGKEELNIQIDDGTLENTSVTAEERGRLKVKEALGIEVPKFLYKPQNFQLKSYNIVDQDTLAIFQYRYENQYIYFRICKINEAEEKIMVVHGKNIEDSISCKMNIDLKCSYTLEKGYKNYTVEWRYGNGFYQMKGIINKDVLEKILENMQYEL